MRTCAAYVLVLALLLPSCHARDGAGVAPRAETSASSESTDAGVDDAAAPEACEEQVAAPAPLPGVAPEQRTAAYWLERAPDYGDPDEPLLTAAAIADHDRALRSPVEGRALGWTDLVAPVDPQVLQAEIADRLDAVRGMMASGEYVERNGNRFPEEALDPFRPPAHPLNRRDEWRVALAPLQIRCGPRREGLYTSPVDPAFDRNNCGSARPQELVRVLAGWDGGLQLVRTASAFGWVPDAAPLSPAVPENRRELLAHGARVRAVGEVALRSADGAAVVVPDGTLLTLLPDAADRVVFATAAGLRESEPIAATLRPTRRDLTRRALLEEAFARLDVRYGWGGQDAGLDCSGFVQEVFATFDLELPRHSGRQALAGTYTIATEGLTDSAERLRLIEAAARTGIVVLQLPGHIMLYLGETPDGTPMAIHSFSEYLTPCATPSADGGPRETRHRVDRVDVSDLWLGRGSSKGAFLDRITHVTVLGRPPGTELAGAATLRAAAPVDVPEGDACGDSLDVRIFRSPQRPSSARPLRVIVTSTRDPGPVELALIDPDGRRLTPAAHRLGGPPWTWWVALEQPVEGEWTAVFGDGSRVEACKRIRVARHPARPAPRAPDDPPWVPSWRWERDTDNLYAAFVEQLFREPLDEEATWPSLQVLLRDPQRNLLHDHLGLGEDEKLVLVPDCADLPYFLRAYVSWKLRLPFAFRRCTRGRAGAPPTCIDPPFSNIDPYGPQEPPPPADVAATSAEPPREALDEPTAFQEFIDRVANTVHSATARTVPSAAASDLYPVALTRETLPPGAVFADPYGHTLVVVRWIPEGLDEGGVLLGADAQPDGTVGRRRFWRGSFLFTPETVDAGAGFKAWRPAVYDAVADAVTELDDDALRRSGDHPAFSDEQYRGSADDFYDRMEELINPRPLEPLELQATLVDALQEAVTRRVVSVDNGARWVAEHPDKPIVMPEGYDVFETEGPWEDYATPARDMRLLISIDTVLGFPDSLLRRPERFGLTAEQAQAAAADLRAKLGPALAERRLTYVRSDGATQTLTLQDVVDRRDGFEVAYNPSDCVEVRWAAPEGSDELRSCARRAPDDQRALLEQYRAWFRERRRPPR